MASVAGGVPRRSSPGENDTPAVSPKIHWAAVAWFGLLLIAGSFSILKRLALQWTNDGDMGHGFSFPWWAPILPGSAARGCSNCA